ncbi:acyl-CoA carboxylase subunit epsilon [Streptomyces armeniacus]|uniref:Acyl-CoA carboxylase subunit epsilon n=1 Tax=Streptomyces armeniacus TaxID=83291 RepID=A0A345XRN5_9ACTN|nr:acyl-CoA carboxylase epsilon subunit [Streptomyces armeniacus]AWS21286.1 hypothetical protein [Streptomyces armeniacus]AXK34301.1 acyl-CoA carboxylase subunit epsilon [Streptomyces armeniacus]AZY92022.1 putative acyl-CoA carboxylase epsilon subunit [Streptomyces armeniacus]
MNAPPSPAGTCGPQPGDVIAVRGNPADEELVAAVIAVIARLTAARDSDGPRRPAPRRPDWGRAAARVTPAPARPGSMSWARSGWC